MLVDLERWSGEGEFTQVVIDRLRLAPRVALLRVEDAPASRAESEYAFISNEVFVHLEAPPRTTRALLRAMRALTRTARTPAGSLRDIEAFLSADHAVGSPDYADEGMIQYLRTQRIVPPYQTRGYKLVELVRIYAAGF